MNILIVGSGGREHAIAYKVKQSPLVKKIFFAPGNAGTAALGSNIDIAVTDITVLKDFAVSNNIGLTIVGPELPLSLGIVECFKKAGLKIFGPEKNAACLESSKTFSKEFMLKYKIPTAAYHVFTTQESALNHLSSAKYPLVIKADGLAAGKGVVVCESPSTAAAAIKMLIQNKLFANKGEKLVVEEFLQGKEVSLICFTDGETIVPMQSASDYKRAFDDEKGPNTGGMGSISPSPYYTKDSCEDIVQKTLKGIQEEGFNYCGVIYIGLMLTAKGAKVLEYNVRFGDPETQALLPRLESDLVKIMLDVLEHKLSQSNIKWSDKMAVTVVVAASGYPDSYKTGEKIILPANKEDVFVFHGGTKLQGGSILSDGGRVLAVTALAENLSSAREACYEVAEKIEFASNFYRKDIGLIPEKIYTGKTKDVYKINNNLNRLFFKDDVTSKDGVFDPGANTVELSIDENGYYGLKMSKFFFESIEKAGIKTHYANANLKEKTMDVLPVTFLGKGIEVICRYVATGSFIRRYGKYMKEGTALDSFVEISLKDDARGDPFISEDLMLLFNILKAGEYSQIKDMTIKICKIIKDILSEKNIKLYDIKLEFGKDKAGNILLIDEISGGNMRAFKDGKILTPIELSKICTD